MIVTGCCTNGCNLLYQTIKYDFENFGEGQLPGCPYLVSGLVLNICKIHGNPANLKQV